MAEQSAEVSERLAVLQEYQQLAPEYVSALEAEEVARGKREELEGQLRAIVDRIGRDPAGILPRRRKRKAADESGDKPRKGKSRAELPESDEPVAE